MGIVTSQYKGPYKFETIWNLLRALQIVVKLLRAINFVTITQVPCGQIAMKHAHFSLIDIIDLMNSHCYSSIPIVPFFKLRIQGVGILKVPSGTAR